MVFKDCMCQSRVRLAKHAHIHTHSLTHIPSHTDTTVSLFHRTQHSILLLPALPHAFVSLALLCFAFHHSNAIYLLLNLECVPQCFDIPIPSICVPMAFQFIFLMHSNYAIIYIYFQVQNCTAKDVPPCEQAANNLLIYLLR